MSEDVIRAKSFQLVDDAGQVRAALSLDDDGLPVWIYAIKTAIHGSLYQ